jgi:hypothetical protein
MQVAFSARQTSVYSSELERMSNMWSPDVAAVASICGWHGLSGQQVITDVGGALNILVLSIARSYGVELLGMRQYLPGLRSEALLILGRYHSSWHYDGPDELEQSFYTKLSGPESEVRSIVASLLGVSQYDATTLLRFHSPRDVECLKEDQLELRHSGRPALFSINAASLADRVQAACQKPLFVSTPKLPAF